MAGYSSIYDYGTRNAAAALGIGDNIDFGLSSGPLDVSGLGDNSLVATPSIPGIDGGGLFGSGIGLQDAQLALAGLGTVANIYNSFQSQKLANKQYKLARNVANANMTNQVQSYNTSLADRLSSRGKVEGTSDSDVQAQIAAASLKNRSL